MRRVKVDQYGPPSVLEIEELSDPTPAAGEVLVAVSYAGVTFVETQVRAGRPPWSGPLPPLPYLPGNAVEGEVIATGHGVDRAVVGSRVVTATGGTRGYADRVTVDAGTLIPVPDTLPPGHAVALLADGRTALSVARAASMRSGESVVVTAAAGGVGSLLVQLAAGTGTVIALAGGEQKCAHATALGADIVIDYSRPEWSRQLSQSVDTHGMDLAFDGVGGAVGAMILDVAPPRSRLSIFGMASGSYTDASLRDVVLKGITVIGGVQVHSQRDNSALSTEALARAVDGRLVATIGQVFPLARAAEAHAAIESRSVIGKTLLEC